MLQEDDWSVIYRSRILPLIDEEKFRHLYSESEGRPNAPIRTMVSLLIFMGAERLSWRLTEFQFQRRLDWWHATNTPVVKNPIDHTTLFKFYERLEADDTARELFTSLANQFIEACGTSIKKQRTDSFFIHGWLRILSRYGLFKETIRKFLQNLRKQKPGLYENIKGQLSQNYLDDEFDLTEKDKELAQKKISLMAKDLYRLKMSFENHKQVMHYESYKILSQIFTQQCEVKENPDSDPEIVIKEKPDKGAICTPHNTEARYTRKGKQRITGDKGFVTETCDPANKTQFILDIDVNEATRHDSKEAGDIQDRLIENGFKPEKQYQDAGFVNGQTILNSQAKSIDMEGPTAGRSQSFAEYTAADRPFDAGDFASIVDEQSQELIVTACPIAQKPMDQKISDKTGELIVHFDPAVCHTCAHANRCPAKIGKRSATYTVNKAEYVGAVRHHQYMSDENYRKECAIRAGVEATISELTRAHGMRKAHHRERSRTRLQFIFAGLACNIKRFIRHGQRYGYLTPELA
jgi:hypothetical protein